MTRPASLKHHRTVFFLPILGVLSILGYAATQRQRPKHRPRHSSLGTPETVCVSIRYTTLALALTAAVALHLPVSSARPAYRLSFARPYARVPLLTPAVLATITPVPCRPLALALGPTRPRPRPRPHTVSVRASSRLPDRLSPAVTTRSPTSASTPACWAALPTEPLHQGESKRTGRVSGVVDAVERADLPRARPPLRRQDTDERAARAGKRPPHRLASTCPPQVDDTSGVAHVHRSLFGSLPTQSSAAWGVSRVSHLAQPSRPHRSLCSACAVVGPCSRVPALARTRLRPRSFFHTGARTLFRSQSSPGPRRGPQRLRFGGVRPPSHSAHSSLARPRHSFAPPVSAPHARSRLDLALALGPFRAPPPRLHLSATRQLVRRHPRSSARPSALFAGLASPLAIARAATNAGKPSFDIATTALTALCPPARAGHLYLAIQAAVSRVSHPVHAPQPRCSPFASPPLLSRISALACTLVCLHP
ncbi:hypothetical protein FRC08_007003 [Ceratobasidium sp. 394]|nr:hypothetical protein FRC08_007003 [Ceratobasidium sp. 394]